MAVILENIHGRRMIRVSTDDIISIVREYQTSVCGLCSYDEIRNILGKKEIYLPEDVQ